MTVGRNEPCPCGSGKKYKRCCIGRDEAAYTGHDRSAAMAALASFARSDEFGDVLDYSLDRLHGEMLDGVPAELMREVLRDAMGDISTFIHLDLVLDDGSTIVGRFLEGPARRLGAGQRTYLERMKVAAVRPYEVLAVREDEGIELRDVLANETLFVTERAGTHEILPGFGLGARLITGKTGRLELEQPTHAFSQTELLQLAKDLRRQQKRLGRSRASFEVTFRDALHRELLAIVVHRAWLARVVLQHRGPRLVFAGEPMMIARVLFDAVAPERIAAGLRAEPCVVVDDERSWTWLESPEPPARVLATIRIEGRRLVAEAFSEERANRVRGFLERRLGDAVRYRITELTDPMQALREHGARKEPGEERAPDRDLPDEVRALAAAQIVKHYEEWVDAALPALDGRTPRQAARLSSLRPQLIALLRDMDLSGERARRSGDVVNAVDFTPVWETLGLMEQRRPGSTVSAARPAAPAAGIPDAPNASDFADLEALLDQRLAWSNGMDIAMFDGLLCAIASSPEPVPQAEWLPIVVGGEPTMFDEASSHQRLLSLLSKHADDVGRDLRAGTYAPIFWPKAPEGMPSVASPWCSGYSRGIALREKAWAPMFKDEHMRSLLIPILGLAIPLHSKDPAPPAKRDRKVLERSIPACANMIFSYWHEGWRPSADRSPAPEATVHRLKIALLGVKPQVWRRVELASGAKLPTVSRVLLAAMGWLDYHLHEFVVGGTHIGTESRDFPRGVLSERNRTLDEIAPSTGDRFDFEYDFGDGWRHRVTVEAIVPAETGVSYPRCVAGARACPPEDCGGIGGYEQFLEAIADPENEQHDSMLGWAGGSFDPTAFDMESVNKRLRRFSRKARSL